MTLTTLALTVLSLLLSIALTGLMRRYAIRANLLDRPNERSSHTVPTPRGGGVAIVVTFLLALVLAALFAGLSSQLATALGGAGVLVAALGFIDDRHNLPARVRFTGHAAAAAWVIYWMGSVPVMPILGHQVNLSFFGPALSFLFITWMINLFNFMDGIDGLAGLEALTVALSGALLWWAYGEPGGEWITGLLFAAAVLGFLVWNFPPAKIFMGDAGSGFIGLTVASLALWCGQATPALFWSWFILIGCFMVDATTTLIRRVRRGERFSEAHRTHAYQYASRLLGAHRPVTLAVGLINVAWLFPIAAAVARGWLDGVAGVALAYAPLLWLAFRHKAGDRAGQQHLA